MPQRVTDIIHENMGHCTPNNLVPLIQAEFPNITSAQVYSAWIKLSEELWKHAENPLESAKQLLEELRDEVEVVHTKVADGVEQLCWVLKKITGPLGKGVVEVALDATYRTNSAHLELYCVMAEDDNAGFPLSYCLLSTATSIEQRKRTKALCRWVRKLRDQWDVHPEFVHIDKDMAEIGMVRKVWPHAKIQLCWWHLRRAVRERLAKTKLSTTPYNPIRARLEFSFIDVDFQPPGAPDTNEASTITNPHLQVETEVKRDFGPTELMLPDGRKVKIIPPVPRTMSDDEASDNETVDGRRTFCPPEYRESIQKLMDSYLHTHPLIPGYAAPTPEGIREWAVRQMYKYCEQNDLREAWAYLWENWYRPVSTIARLKTTMVMESHWRRIKKDFLHHFHKPRVDFLVWILMVKLAPSYYRRLDLIQRPVGRGYRNLSSWRQITYPLNPKYKPNVHRWVCTCPYFAKSRFLVCKHLVQMVKEVPVTFFHEVTRNRTSPIWSHPSLKPKHQLDTEMLSYGQVGIPTSSPTSPTSSLPSSPTSSPALNPTGLPAADSDDDENDDDVDMAFIPSHIPIGTFEQRLTGWIYKVRNFGHLLEYQKQFRDSRMLDVLDREGARFERLIDDCLAVETRENHNRGDRARTWDTARANAMYFRSRPRRSENPTWWGERDERR
ncbi:hypothetical protein K435DRAFT_825684 [Dendrothele bispora CBS 962.96]|uniref:SWIM-type domain-containing protein n=1 Tax=Dendrothele bispora (strain CBS 962.96) TaxID=1314807 RepID=A0A4S8MVK0_DENBC|nr:hypothetical protein K435DRAFT_825684 [Dendrothele bispora CBS 962.96]